MDFYCYMMIAFILVLFIFCIYRQIIHEIERKYKTLAKLLPDEFCKEIITEGETHEWSKHRHENYATIDNEITKDWKCYHKILEYIENVIYKEMEKIYGTDNKKIGINEIFIIKYSMEGQRSLEFHEDGSEYSFVISLNDEYEGGGTSFKCDNSTVKLGTGDCLLFSGQNTHKGNPITSGTRYVLAGFLSYNGPINIF
jgi:hypothetical protein